MVRLEGFMEIQQLHHDGVNVSEIARRLDRDRNDHKWAIGSTRNEEMQKFCHQRIGWV